MGILSRHKKEKTKAEKYYDSIGAVKCPFFNATVDFNSDGFHHLQFSDRRERDKKAQLLKFELLPLVVDVVQVSGTHQEYRKIWGKYGKKKNDGSQTMKEMQFWGFVAIVVSRRDLIRIKIILRQVGDGKIIFWSVMPDLNLKNLSSFSLASNEITDG